MSRPAALLAVALALTAGPALARDVSGVNVPDTVTVAGKALKLNGAGLRKKFVVKVYVGALYLEQASADANAIVAADAPKAVRMTFLRDLSREQVMGAFREGFENNSKDVAGQVIPLLDRVAQVIPAHLKEGQTLVVTYAPGLGSTVGLEGAQAATVPGKPFADALFRNWLGKEPADEGLRRAMLGR